jgi:hypothetical protein
MGRFVRRPSPAMLVAVTALVSSFTGPAIADQAATIAAKLNGSKIKTRSISGSKLKNNTITGKQVAESKLGKVPSAARADSATSATNATNATNASQLGGKPDSSFLLKTDTAADSSKLGDRLPSQFARFSGYVTSSGVIGQGDGFTVSKGGTGSYTVSFPAGTFSPEPGAACHFPIPGVSALGFGSAIFANASGMGCSSTGSGSFTVRTFNDAGTAVDSAFVFVAL